MADNRLKGLSKMLRTLDSLDGASKKAATSGVNAGLAWLVGSIKRAIDASPADPSVKRIAKQTIGKRIVRQKRAEIREGKVGFGVGKKSKKTQSKRRDEASARAADSSLPGVGASASNIHWFVLGTEDRTTKGGHETGNMDPELDGVIEKAISVGAVASLEVAALKAKQVLAREAAKAKAKAKG